MSEIKDRTLALVRQDRQETRNQAMIVKDLPKNLQYPSDTPWNVKNKLDSFVSIMTELNGHKDRKNSYDYCPDRRLSWQTLKDMVKGSPMTRVIVNSVVDEAYKRDIDILDKRKDEIKAKLKKIEYKDYSRRGAKEGRVHGKAGVFYFINDGNPEFIPVDCKRITEIKPAFVLNKWQMNGMCADPVSGMPMPYLPGLPIEFYRVTFYGTEYIFHKSRVLIYTGEYCGEDNYKQNLGNPESLIDLHRKPIFLYELFCDSISTLSDNAIQEVIQIDGLEDKLIQAQNDPTIKNNIMANIMAMMMGKSVVNKLLLDGKDKYGHYSANLTGYKEIESIAKNFLAASTRYPKSKLFGDSPAGGIGSDTGSYEEDVWKDIVKYYQTEEMQPNQEMAINWVLPLPVLPEEIIIPIKYPSLYEMTPLEEANIKFLDSQTFGNHVTNRILRPERVGLSLFGQGEYSSEVQLDDSEIADYEKALKEPPQEQQEQVNNTVNNQNNNTQVSNQDVEEESVKAA